MTCLPFAPAERQVSRRDNASRAFAGDILYLSREWISFTPARQPHYPLIYGRLNIPDIEAVRIMERR
jgi:hypothetical protein